MKKLIPAVLAALFALTSVSSAGMFGCTSSTASASDASGNTCSTHWRKALANGAWAMMKIPLFMSLYRHQTWGLANKSVGGRAEVGL